MFVAFNDEHVHHCLTGKQHGQMHQIFGVKATVSTHVFGRDPISAGDGIASTFNDAQNCSRCATMGSTLA